MEMYLAELLQKDRPFSLRMLHSLSTLDVLVLAPHPDDFDTVGLTMRFLKANHNRISVVVMRTAGGVEDAFCSPPTREAKTAIREEEQRQSCRFFGLKDEDLAFLSMEQDEQEEPILTSRNLAAVEDVMLKRRPNLVFIPHGNDTNSGHRTVHAIFNRIAAASGFPVVAFLNRDPKTISMRTDCFTEFGEEEAQWKSRLLRFHASQHQRNLNIRNRGFDERILDVNRATARELGLNEEYAEAFELELHGAGAEAVAEAESATFTVDHVCREKEQLNA
jgi:LmbE family N-acetylglucosaminyl deacetylase